MSMYTVYSKVSRMASGNKSGRVCYCRILSVRVRTCPLFAKILNCKVFRLRIMIYCAVKNCKTSLNQPGISFHRFPSDKKARDAWISGCGLDASHDHVQSYVCSNHFSDDDFVRDLKGELLKLPLKRIVKEGVVPHINLFQIKQEPTITDSYETEHSNKFPSAALSTFSFSKSNLDNANFENSTNINIPVEMIPPAPVESTVHVTKNIAPLPDANYVPSSLPGRQDWPGIYDFTVSFDQQERNTKGISWIYSELKNKLYVGKDVPCPINFSANTSVSDNVSIRVMALYESPEHASEVVHRCLNHSMDELGRQIFEAEHLVRCESKMACYKVDLATKRHSVVIPFEVPAAGQHYSTYIYRFACFGSCAGGPNRRAIMLIFTLEKDGQVVGRRKVDVKICACPGRDKKTEEQMLMPKQTATPAVKRKEHDYPSLADTLEFTKHIKLPPPSKKVKLDHDRKYMIKADNRDQYDFLIQMKLFFEMSKAMRNLPPHIARALANLRQKSSSDVDST